MKYEQFKLIIYKLSNIDLNCYKERQMKRRIDTFIKKNNYKEYGDFLQALRENEELYSEFLSYITINVSEFFRNPRQWDILKNIVLPEYLSKDEIRIWSCACSTGDEPYSLAMLLAEFISMKKIKIFATDIDKMVLKQAKKGIYDYKSLLNVPSEMLGRYFKRIDSKHYKISDEIKKCVHFRRLNLLEDEFPKRTDLILCRNVIIYFTDDAKNALYKKFYNSLNSNGVLFLGCTEQIVDYKEYNYDLIESFFYKKIV